MSFKSVFFDPVFLKILLIKIIVLVFFLYLFSQYPYLIPADTGFYESLIRGESFGYLKSTIGYALFLLPFYSFFQSYFIISTIASFLFSFFALYILAKIDKKAFWILFFYPFFFFYSNIGIETSAFLFFTLLGYYYYKKNSNIKSAICWFFSPIIRLEGISFGFQLLYDRKIYGILVILGFLFSISLFYFYYGSYNSYSSSGETAVSINSFTFFTGDFIRNIPVWISYFIMILTLYKSWKYNFREKIFLTSLFIIYLFPLFNPITFTGIPRYFINFLPFSLLLFKNTVLKFFKPILILEFISIIVFLGLKILINS